MKKSSTKDQEKMMQNASYAATKKKKKARMVIVTCYYCDNQVQKLVNEQKYRKVVVFCHAGCFKKYLDRNRPNCKFMEPKRYMDIINRLTARMVQIERDLLFLSPKTHRYHVLEEIFNELTKIKTGRESMTSHLKTAIQILNDDDYGSSKK